MLEKSLTWYKAKFGDKRGLKKFNNRLSVKTSLENYFNLYGESEETVKKYNEDKKWHHKYESLLYNVFVYGEVEGLKKYNEKLQRRKESNKKRGFTLDLCIQRHGLEKGTELYNKRINELKKLNSVLHYIEKYGEIEGPIQWKKYCASVSGSKENYIKRYGKEEGLKRYNSFRKKCATNTIEWYKNKYGDIIGEKKYNEAAKKRNKLNIEYYINLGYSYEDASKLLSERLRTSTLEKFIKCYGEGEGYEKYIETNKSKASTLENYIRKYGKVNGTIKYNQWLKNQEGKGSLKWYINKYGEINGIEKYNKSVINRLKNTKSVSSIGSEFCNNLYNKLIEENIIFNLVFFNENEYMFFISKKYDSNFKVIKPDFYIKDINLCIEFYGDFWHGWTNKNNADKIRQRDKQRIDILLKAYNCDVIIIWEHEYNANKEKSINEIILKIKEKIN